MHHTIVTVKDLLKNDINVVKATKTKKPQANLTNEEKAAIELE